MILQGSVTPHSASRKRSKNVYYVYILRCSGDRLYTGITTDPERRLREHSGLDAGGARFTRANPPEGFAAPAPDVPAEGGFADTPPMGPEFPDGGFAYAVSAAPEGFAALWSTDTRSRAQSLEYRIKHLTRSRKTALIEDNSLMEEYFGAELSAFFTRLSPPYT